MVNLQNDILNHSNNHSDYVLDRQTDAYIEGGEKGERERERSVFFSQGCADFKMWGTIKKR